METRIKINIFAGENLISPANTVKLPKDCFDAKCSTGTSIWETMPRPILVSALCRDFSISPPLLPGGYKAGFPDCPNGHLNETRD
jgi:hypothetical protein